MLSTILSVSLATTSPAAPSAHIDAARTNEPAPVRLTHGQSCDAPIIASAASSVQFGMLDDHQPVPTFGAEGSWRFQIQAGGAFEPKRTRNKAGFGGVGVSYFLLEGLSMDFELNGYYFSQRGNDTGGGNFNLLFRWHFVSEPTWSLYFDGGAGVLLTGDRVPDNGTRFNFTPQAGLGVSFEIKPDLRLMTGLRWHHISNAGTGRSNPGRDHLLGYLMLSMPF